ncbi:MAG: DsbA family protein [Caulobacteraceae bacterium]
MTRLRKALSAIAATVALAGLAAACNAQSSQERGAPAAHESASDKAFGARVRAYLLAHPEVLAEAFDQLQAKQAADKLAMAHDGIVKHRQELQHDPRDGVLGNPNGKVTVVEFSDYRCPFCKAAEPEVEKLLAEQKDVRLVVKEFPIIDWEDQSHLSRDAARVALATLPQGKYAAVRMALLAQKAKLEDPVVDEVLKANGVDVAKARALAADKAIDAHLSDTLQLAHALGIDGTPAFIVGETLIPGAQMDDLRAAIDAARAAAGKRS